MTKRHLVPHTDGRKQSRNSFPSTSSQRHLRPSRFYLPRSSQKSTWAAETTRPRPRTVTHEALVGDSLSTPSRPKPSPIPRTKITLIISNSKRKTHRRAHTCCFSDNQTKGGRGRRRPRAPQGQRRFCDNQQRHFGRSGADGNLQHPLPITFPNMYSYSEPQRNK